jgi:hypothetical protein
MREGAPRVGMAASEGEDEQRAGVLFVALCSSRQEGARGGPRERAGSGFGSRVGFERGASGGFLEPLWGAWNEASRSPGSRFGRLWIANRSRAERRLGRLSGVPARGGEGGFGRLWALSWPASWEWRESIGPGAPPGAALCLLTYSSTTVRKGVARGWMERETDSGGIKMGPARVGARTVPGAWATGIRGDVGEPPLRDRDGAPHGGVRARRRGASGARARNAEMTPACVRSARGWRRVRSAGRSSARSRTWRRGGMRGEDTREQ